MESNSGKRDQWGSKFGFIMAAAGSAIGLGNVWRFPYITGKYGGGALVVIYLLFVIFIGTSVMLAELAIGRKARLDSVGSFKKLGGGAWPLVGWLGFFCAFVILSYYSVTTGWTVAYMFKSLGGLMEQAAVSGGAADAFVAFVSDPVLTILCLMVVMASVVGVAYRGISGGIEKSCKVLMPALFVIILILIVRSVTLPGAEAGLRFYLLPDFSKVSAEGILAAVGQGFYSLSLGMGIMITYGSYLGSHEDMPKLTRTIVLLDTSVAFMAGLVIFPAVFAQMPMGAIFSFAFFALLFIAAFTSCISLFEVVVTFAVDELHWNRAKSALAMGAAITLLGVPSALSVGGHIPQVFGKDFLDALDFITNNAIMPIGGIFVSIFVGWIWTKGALDEISNRGELKFKFYKAWLWICRLIAPVCITAVFITGLKW